MLTIVGNLPLVTIQHRVDLKRNTDSPQQDQSRLRYLLLKHG